MKLNLYPILLAAALCAALFFSCTTNIEMPAPPGSSSSPETGGPSSSSLPGGTVWCLHGETCIALAAETCTLMGGQTVQNCPASSSSSRPASSSSSSSRPASSSSSSSSLPSGMVWCLYYGICASMDAETCTSIGQIVQSCPASSSSSPSSSSAPSSSSSALSSSSLRSSSSIGLLSSSSSLAPGDVFCQIDSTCQVMDNEFCKIIGSIVPSCNLTCEMPFPLPTVSQGSPMDPKPAVKCNGNAVGSGSITWTPSNLNFANSGLQTANARVTNCNNATAVCGQVDVQGPSNLVCTMSATQGMVSVPISPTPTVTCNGTTVSSGISWSPASLIPTAAGTVNVSATYVCNSVQKTASCGSVNAAPYSVTRNITIIMRDSYSDDNLGWTGNALRINVNGSDRTPNVTLSSGTSGSTSFNANVGDEVNIYWVKGSWPEDVAFAMYYTDDPPASTFNPNAVTSDPKILLYRIYNDMTSVSNGTKLGTFTVQ